MLMRYYSMCILMASGLSMMALGTRAQSFAGEFTPLWQRACHYTLEVAEAMPDSLYSYRPVDSVFTFGEHLLHLERNLYGLCSRFVLQTDRYQVAPAPETMHKGHIIERLRAAISYVDQALAETPDSMLSLPAEGFWGPDAISRRGIFWLMRDHMSHHRGQMVVYLRLNGIEPPRYRGW